MSKYRLSQEALLDEDSRSTGGFQSRKGLFYPTSQKGLRKNIGKGSNVVRILPDINARGPNQVDLWYLVSGQHWFEFQNEQGTTYPAGKVCWSHLREEQPLLYQTLLENTDLTEGDMRCAVCELLKKHEEGEGYDSSIPLNKFKQPVFGCQVSYNFPVVLQENCYEEGDDHIVKIVTGTSTMVRAVNRHMATGGFYPDLLDPEKGNWVAFSLQGKQWNADVNPNPQAIWFKGWSEVVSDGYLERESLNMTEWTYEDQLNFLGNSPYSHLLGG